MLVMATVAFVHFPNLQADEARARISAERARQAALLAVPGTVQDAELERERGRLVYSFDIAPLARHGSFEIVPSGQRGSFAGARPGSGVVEVNVSAHDGSIVNVEREDSGMSRKTEACEYHSSHPEFFEDLL